MNAVTRTRPSVAHDDRGLFHTLAGSSIWTGARTQEAAAAHHLVESGLRASEAALIGTRAQVLAALYLQEWWRRIRDAREEYDECVEIEMVLERARTGEWILSPSKQKPAAALEVPAAPVLPSLRPPSPLAAEATPAEAPKSAADSERGSVEKDVVVARKAADVFDVVCAFDAYPQWVTGLQKVEVLERDETDGIGRLARFTAGAMGLSVCYTLSYNVLIRDPAATAAGLPDYTLSWTSVAGGVKSIVGQYDLTSLDGASTKVAYRLDVDVGFKMPGILRRTATSLVIGAALPDLKRHLEAGQRKKSWLG